LAGLQYTMETGKVTTPVTTSEHERFTASPRKKKRPAAADPTTADPAKQPSAGTILAARAVSPSAAACTVSTDAKAAVTDATAAANLPPPPLELGWTRVTRRRRSSSARTSLAASSTQQRKTTASGTSTGEGEGGGKKGADVEDEERCCDDPSCRRGGGGGPRYFGHEQRPLEEGGGTLAVAVGGGGVDNSNAGSANTGIAVAKGRAIFLLHEPDPGWFQGYLFFDSEGGGIGSGSWGNGSSGHNNKKKPWGLLAQQVTLDECLQCAEGGYRQIKLTVYPYGDGADDGSGNKNEGRRQRQPRKFIKNDVEWFGGDMVRLQGPEVRMRAERLATGRDAVPYVERVFEGLLRAARGRRQRVGGGGGEKTQEETDDVEGDGVLDLMPDCAVVIGEMELALPRTSSNENDELLWT